MFCPPSRYDSPFAVVGTWGGGGVFTDARTLLLNRYGGGLDSVLPHPLPLTVGSLHDAPPSLSPVRELRLGWSSVALPPDDPRTAPRSPSYPRKEPLRLVRSRPRHRGEALEHIVWGYHNNDGPWEIRAYHLTRLAPDDATPAAPKTRGKSR